MNDFNETRIETTACIESQGTFTKVLQGAKRPLRRLTSALPEQTPWFPMLSGSLLSVHHLIMFGYYSKLIFKFGNLIRFRSIKHAIRMG